MPKKTQWKRKKTFEKSTCAHERRQTVLVFHFVAATKKMQLKKRKCSLPRLSNEKNLYLTCFFRIQVASSLVLIEKRSERNKRFVKWKRISQEKAKCWFYIVLTWTCSNKKTSTLVCSACSLLHKTVCSINVILFFLVVYQIKKMIRCNCQVLHFFVADFQIFK